MCVTSVNANHILSIERSSCQIEDPSHMLTNRGMLIIGGLHESPGSISNRLGWVDGERDGRGAEGGGKMQQLKAQRVKGLVQR